MLSMESLWCGSESELSRFKVLKNACDRQEYRLNRRKTSKSLIPQGLLHQPELQPRAHRRTRSGTWPRTRSLNAPSPIQQFGPCGRIMKNSAMVMQIQDPASQRLTWYKPPLTVLVIKKVHDATILAPFVQLVHWLVQEKSMVVFVEAAVLDDRLLKEYGDFTSVRERLMTFRAGTDDLTDKIDFIICLGGDGTLLHASSLFQQSVPPVMAFHLGSLGFLTPFEFNNFQEQVMNVLEGHAALTLRSRLQCVLLRKRTDDKSDKRKPTTILVLNEVVVDRGPSPYLSNIDLFLDGKHITSVQGDGVIVSTPTGSTAYAVAAGASMIHPAVPAVMVTPICPHSLSFRPIVVPAGVELKIMLSLEARYVVSVSFDGRSQMTLRPGDSLYVTTSVYPVPSICARDQISDWFASLAECLHWNVRKKQRHFDELSDHTDHTHSSSDNFEEIDNSHNEEQYKEKDGQINEDVINIMNHQDEHVKINCVKEKDQQEIVKKDSATYSKKEECVTKNISSDSLIEIVKNKKDCHPVIRDAEAAVVNEETEKKNDPMNT